ncbi:MAG: TonB family protein, partial [Candidatus Omnitrophota bacterium]
IVTTSETETTVMIKDGVTIIIGGLKKQQMDKTEKRIPILGDIPFLGMAFRSKTEEMNTTELVILLTPHIMSGESSFTEISQLQPKDGVIAMMDGKGKITTERVVTKLEAPDFTASSYYNFISEKVRKLALSNKPKGHQGSVKVGFSLSRSGNLIDEPKVLQTDNPDLNVFALEAVKFASPFPSFPESLEEAQQSFKIFIEYK